MNDFELKAWESELKVEKLKIKSYKKTRDSRGYNIVIMKLEYEGIPMYTGLRYEKLKETEREFASRKIEYIVTALQTVKDNYEDSRIIEESLKWKIISQDSAVKIENLYLRRYSSAIQKAAGGTKNGLEALEVIEDGVDRFKSDCDDLSFEIEYVLEKDVEKRLKKQGFYKKYPKNNSYLTKLKKKIKACVK